MAENFRAVRSRVATQRSGVPNQYLPEAQRRSREAAEPSDGPNAGSMATAPSRRTPAATPASGPVRRRPREISADELNARELARIRGNAEMEGVFKKGGMVKAKPTAYKRGGKVKGK